MKLPRSIYVTIVCVFVFVLTSHSQKRIILDSITSTTYLDSLLIDRNQANYSLRLFGNYKNQSFHIKNSDSEIEFTPNNRSGIGIGFANNKILIDITFNIKGEEKNPTERFNIFVDFKHKAHFFDFFFQRYKGFNVNYSNNDFDFFRSDIVSISSGIDYLYLFNDNKYQVGTLRSVISDKNETSFSYGLGGFGVFFKHKGKSALINTQNISGDNQNIDKIVGVGGGILIGGAGFFSMGHNFYSSLSVSLGTGLLYKEVKGVSNRLQSSNPLLYKLDSVAVLGYVRDKYYLNLSFELGLYRTEIIKNIDELINVSRAKIAFGYKIFD